VGDALSLVACVAFENPLVAAADLDLDIDQRILGSWHEIGTQYSPGFPEYCCPWVEKRYYSYSPFSGFMGDLSRAKRLWCFNEKPTKLLTVFSPETVNIKKIGQFSSKHQKLRANNNKH